MNAFLVTPNGRYFLLHGILVRIHIYGYVMSFHCCLRRLRQVLVSNYHLYEYVQDENLYGRQLNTNVLYSLLVALPGI